MANFFAGLPYLESATCCWNGEKDRAEGQIYQSLSVDVFGPESSLERSLERGKCSLARVPSSPGREGRAVAGDGDRSSSERE